MLGAQICCEIVRFRIYLEGRADGTVAALDTGALEGRHGQAKAQRQARDPRGMLSLRGGQCSKRLSCMVGPS